MSARKGALTLGMLLACSCSGIYYDALEAVGTTKRELFRSRVVSARDAQQDAKEQFVSALERFKAVRSFEGGELEETYEKLDSELQKSEKRADAMRKRIDAVESVSDALFDEWEDEIEEYTSDSLRRSSERRYRESKRKYEALIASMRRAEDRLDPALAPMRDQVLFLKHNLNAKAIASLEAELEEVEVDVNALVAELSRSVAAADDLIRTMDSGEGS